MKIFKQIRIHVHDLAYDYHKKTLISLQAAKLGYSDHGTNTDKIAHFFETVLKKTLFFRNNTQQKK